MNLAALFGGDPSAWIPSQGRPARCLGNKGMPSYESLDQRILILEAAVVRATADVVAVAPLRYQSLCEECPEGFVAIHSRRQWRPNLHLLSKPLTWERLGSQRELLWRWATSGREWREAERRAKQILLDNLTEHQRLQLILTDKFTVIGGKTGNTYQVELGDGFEVILRASRQVLVHYCLHPEYWMPDEDIALATKLLLEDPETEERTLNRANAFFKPVFKRALLENLGNFKGAARYPEARKATRRQRYIADMEKELL